MKLTGGVLAGPTGTDDIVIRGARVLDPVEGVDGLLDVRIDGGRIARIGDDLDVNGHRVVDGTGLLLVPAFLDPHVHLRTPGREDGWESLGHAARRAWATRLRFRRDAVRRARAT